MSSMTDVARLAGVSVSTVSLVCNKKGYVSEETRARVQAAMDQLGYRPSTLGRNLKMRRSGIIGVIVPDSAHPFFSTFTKYVERNLYARGFKTMICASAGRETVEQEYLDMLDQQAMDALIMGAHSLDVSRYLSVRRPLIALDRYLSDQIPTVRSDKEQIARMAAELFASRGRKKIVQLVSSGTIRTFDDARYATFAQLMAAQGAQVVDVALGFNCFTPDAYAEGVARAFDQVPDADGVLGVDMAALACLREAAKRGIRVPEDLSVVAIDGTYVTQIGPVELTAIVQQIDVLARRATDMAVSMVAGGGQPEGPRVIDVKLQQGETL